MLCPFCLSHVQFAQTTASGPKKSIYQCPECKEETPRSYVEKYGSHPPVVVSAVGFREHGKTVYFAALFYALKKLRLAHHWPKFFTMALNEESLNTVNENMALLEGGELPDSTPKNFPRPTMLRVTGVPVQPDGTLLCYDTGGESFEKASQLVQHAHFVSRARTAMLLVSVPNLKDPATEMHKLLNTYVIGMADLKTDTRNQHLVVVYTKADEMADRLDGCGDLLHYLRQGSVDGLGNPGGYMGGLRRVSQQLQAFTGEKLGAHEFLNAARQSFRSVEFSVISALGARPSGRKLPSEILPRRIFDPLLWMMEKSLPGWRQIWRRWV